MKKVLLSSLIIFQSIFSNAQKPPINIESYKSWNYVTYGNISNNGKYVFYSIVNLPVGKNTLVIQSTSSDFEKKFIDFSAPSFSDDSKTVAGKILDTLIIFDLEKKQVRKIPGVQSYFFFDSDGVKGIIYKSKYKNRLTLELANGKLLKEIDSVKQFIISPNKSSIIIDQQQPNAAVSRVSFLSLKDQKSGEIYHDTGSVSNFLFSNRCDQMAFITRNQSKREIWVYNFMEKKAKVLINSKNIDNQLIISGDKFWRFSPNDSLIIFTLTEPDRKKNESSNPEIWSYKDLYLSSYFKGSSLLGFKNFTPRNYLSAISIKDAKFKKLLNPGEEIDDISFSDKESPFFVYKYNFNLDTNAYYLYNFSYGLCDINTGEKYPIDSNCRSKVTNFAFSSDHRYLVYYKAETRQYYSHNTKTHEEICLSKKVGTLLIDKNCTDLAHPENYPTEVVGWIQDQNQVLISDSYDIWAFDLAGKEEPVNLTQGFGKKNNTSIYPIENKKNGYEKNIRRYNSKDKMTLKSFNWDTKEMGFHSMSLKKPWGMVFLSKQSNSIGQGLFYNYEGIGSIELCESQNHNGYLIKKGTCEDAPNYFYSKDLRQFKRLSNQQPQEKYNWMTSELHTYQDSVGNKCQGVLYKPENFNPSKKYPIIINYYSNYSNRLNVFFDPDITGEYAEVAYWVSNGYIVYRPDIYLFPEKPGEGVLQSLYAALNHLSTYSFINLKKVALTGSSLGGWETNYAITHLKWPITAAVSEAGVSDFVAFTFTIGRNGTDRFSFTENGIFKSKKSIENCPDIYTENSPLYSAQNISTPLLLLHNPLDRQVEVYQSQALFIQLRKLGKPVWFLSYEGEDHGMRNLESITDYKKKKYEFMDYFLKDYPEPNWMMSHINSTD
ncbi:S9 family peptidase [Chitinophaga sp. HK235]|uniref:alpha/beta hydrolase family protein n=1 Tax=Chitinophaga sp. HK235 TaxID=2952571 RepID=UPI001BA5E374|nr:prolyl oligopeptidase family serine peptidase [Chitinophaga sp. HK235]